MQQKTRHSEGKTIAESDTITMRLKIDSRGRIQIREEDRDFLGLTGGELLEVTIRRANAPKKL
jgi:bifunctional DNA-binding transcriptional regulator/antitoxin component of YhaV-PrlF toxin-antitoxin module